ncbi:MULTISPECIES: MFS transporter [unclassified Francisella]|uniref:MFS transporter n=1 Tax=unclassified Francisella TaxID=2610885 RepID=UPI002E354A3F|nr:MULTISPECIES: MFS transporter [unclassified Francisella]MED7819081.1 MFS transporter [Francisella sp. 19S2-4]MED7829959.1 MFS transporter [Francisella sp. 19S2-10]
MQNKYLAYYPMILMSCYWVIIKAGLPFVDDMSHFFDVSHQSIQQILSLSLIISSISPLISGPLIDHVGLKRFAIYASILSFIITGIMLLTANIIIFTLAYIIATSIILSLSVCSRGFPFIYFNNIQQKQHAISIAFMGVYFCSFIIPFFSGWIGFYLGWQFGYVLVLAWLVIIIIAIAKLKERQNSTQQTSFIKNITTIFFHLKTKWFIRYTLFVAILDAIAWTYIIALPFWLADTFNISAKYLAFYLFPLALPGLLCPIIVKILDKFIHRNSIIKLGLIILILSGILAILVGLKTWDYAFIYVIPGVLLNLASSITFSIASTRIFTNVKTLFNAASGLFSLIQYFAFGALVFIESYISIDLFYLEGVLICVCGVLLIILQRHKD